MTKTDELFCKLHDIVRASYHYPPTAGKLTLIETERGAVCREVPLKKKGKILVFKFDIDETPGFLPFLNDSLAGVMKVCDYIVIYPRGSRLFVFLCELKSHRTTEGQADKSGQDFI